MRPISRFWPCPEWRWQQPLNKNPHWLADKNKWCLNVELTAVCMQRMHKLVCEVAPTCVIICNIFMTFFVHDVDRFDKTCFQFVMIIDRKGQGRKKVEGPRYVALHRHWAHYDVVSPSRQYCSSSIYWAATADSILPDGFPWSSIDTIHIVNLTHKLDWTLATICSSVYYCYVVSLQLRTATTTILQRSAIGYYCRVVSYNYPWSSWLMASS